MCLPCSKESIVYAGRGTPPPTPPPLLPETQTPKVEVNASMFRNSHFEINIDELRLLLK